MPSPHGRRRFQLQDPPALGSECPHRGQWPAVCAPASPSSQEHQRGQHPHTPSSQNQYAQGSRTPSQPSPSCHPEPSCRRQPHLSLIHISEPTRLRRISYAVFCLKKKKKKNKKKTKKTKKIKTKKKKKNKKKKQ